MDKKYEEWRKIQDELDAETDCGEKSVREDFTRWADLKYEISFEDMLKLESEYEA